MNGTRREFLTGSAWMTAAALAGGCQLTKLGLGEGGTMANFAAPPLRRVRVGFVGIGSRGTWAIHRLALIPGVEIAAICDKNPERLAENRAWLAGQKKPAAREYGGEDGWRALCDWDGVDVVYACTPWELHVPVALAAMRGGKHALVEVPAAMDVDSCWELVETSEATRRHCMMLENCCYGENEMLALNLCRLGLLGETVYGEAGYLHTTNSASRDYSKGRNWRDQWYAEHGGNLYPTHGLGPVAQYMSINRGDRFDYLTSVDSMPLGRRAHGESLFGKGTAADRFYDGFKLGYYNSSLIRTVAGRTILLSISMHTPHPYSRINTIQGTKGIVMDFPLRIALAEQHMGEVDRRFDEKKTEEYRERYRHPMWKTAGKIAEKVGGHGGMDMIMDLRWVYCLQNGLPLDMDVYDLAAWSCLCEITERSVDRRGAPVEIPDFTRGAWRRMRPLGIEDIDLKKMNFDGRNVVGGDKAQQTV